MNQPDMPTHPTDILLELIVAFLAPMFITASCGDLHFARLAAMETMQSYGARTQAELMNIAQIIGFGLAAMDSLCLSMADELALSMKLRLRGNANALNRSAQQHQRVLDQRRCDNPTQMADPEPSFDDSPITEAEIEASIAHANAMAEAAHACMQPAPMPAAQAQPAQARPAQAQAVAPSNESLWANAMTNVAGELTANLAHVSPEQRRVDRMWADALGRRARDLTEADLRTEGTRPVPAIDRSAR
jgi:hypothetical protein